jgi:hypothetical protein
LIRWISSLQIVGPIFTFASNLATSHIIMQKKKKKNKTEKNKEVEIIITHLMKRLYAEGTLCLFSGAGHKQAGHKHRHIKITLLAFKFCILPPHLLLPSLRISISHTHFFIKNSLLASQEKQQYCTIILY